MASANVTNEEFKSKIESLLSINKVVNYYGMVEQTGTYIWNVNMAFFMHPYSDIIVRRPLDFSVAEVGESGLIQTLSILPHSYPGHSILTEDIGYIQGEDDCKCGTLGKYFKVTGRIQKQKFVAVVTHMKLANLEMNIIAGCNPYDLSRAPDKIFSKNSISFLAALSKFCSKKK